MQEFPSGQAALDKLSARQSPAALIKVGRDLLGFTCTRAQTSTNRVEQSSLYNQK